LKNTFFPFVSAWVLATGNFQVHFFINRQSERATRHPATQTAGKKTGGQDPEREVKNP
jgi:hypothetical protein